MPRGISAEFIAALGSDEIRPFYAVELQLDVQPVRLWTGNRSVTIEGNEYLGAGNLLNFSGFEEVNDLSAKAITISFSGLDSTILSLALSTPIQNRKTRVFFGVIDASDVVHSIEIFSGLANTIPFEDDGDTGTVNLSVDSKLVLLEKASNWRYTDESHRARYPGDSFFSYVADLQDRELVWGRARA